MRLVRFFLSCLWILELMFVCVKAYFKPDLIEHYPSTSTTASEATIQFMNTTTSTTEPITITTTKKFIGDPTTIQCDHTVYENSQCPPPLFCLYKGHCGCTGDQIYSISRNLCTKPAGSHGCTKSGQCTDYAHCWHPGNKRLCRTWLRRYRWHRTRFTRCIRRQGPTSCHCCRGPKSGVGGVCPPSDFSDCDEPDYDDDNARNGNEYGSLPQSRVNQVLRNLLAVFLTTIISIYIIK